MGSLQVDCEALLALREDDGLFAYHVQYDEHVSQDVAKGNIRYGDWDARLAQIEEVMETAEESLQRSERRPLFSRLRFVTLRESTSRRTVGRASTVTQDQSS